MNIVLLFLVVSTLVIDFLSLHKHDFKTVIIYLIIVSLIITATVVNKYDVLEMSPVEKIIEIMTPIVDWISNSIRKL